MLAIVTWLCLGVTSSHPFHVTIAEVEFNPVSGHLEVALRVYPEDIEDALRRRVGDEVRLRDPSVPEDEGPDPIDALIASYLETVFIVEDAQGARGEIRWVGKESSLKAVWLYFEVSLPGGLSGSSFRNRIFFELHPDQANTLLLSEGDFKTTLTLTREKRHGSVSPELYRTKIEKWRLSLDSYRDRVRGAWLGQMIGVCYGYPYEFKSLGRMIEGPLDPWTSVRIDDAFHQDDLYVEITFLDCLSRLGLEVDAAQAGDVFRDTTYRLWHANHQARENLRRGIKAPESGHPQHNPHADDIDFQIEADVLGLIAPGLPRASAEFCDVFGSLMNWGDGLYGGRFIAAMYSQALREQRVGRGTVENLVRSGLKAIPEESDYAAVVRQVLASYLRNPADWQGAWKEIEERWGDRDLCPEGQDKPLNIDAKLNGAYVTIGLLFGGGDFETTLEIATRCGQDADCNPSNAAGILGALYGASSIPATFKNGLAERIGQRKFEGTDYDFSKLLKTTEEVATKVILRHGGRLFTENDELIFEIPLQRALPPATLDQMRVFLEGNR